MAIFHCFKILGVVETSPLSKDSSSGNITYLNSVSFPESIREHRNTLRNLHRTLTNCYAKISVEFLDVI
jgi:hypothetical protein